MAEVSQTRANVHQDYAQRIAELRKRVEELEGKVVEEKTLRSAVANDKSDSEMLQRAVKTRTHKLERDLGAKDRKIEKLEKALKDDVTARAV